MEGFVSNFGVSILTEIRTQVKIGKVRWGDLIDLAAKNVGGYQLWQRGK